MDGSLVQPRLHSPERYFLSVKEDIYIVFGLSFCTLVINCVYMLRISSMEVATENTDHHWSAVLQIDPLLYKLGSALLFVP